jgi:Flp pilus assembly protein TadD
MELTIEQALQRGVAAHKEGKLEEAERLYRAILQSQPAHPDANHNLGVIAVSFNKADAALPLFKTALEANPKVEQFWLSYIDALIKEKQFDNAKQVLEQGRKLGLVGDKVDALEAQLKNITQSALPKSPEKKKSLTLKEKRKKIAASKQQKKQAKGKNAHSLSPSQSQVDNLFEHYQNGRYDEAEKLAVTITQEFPRHQFGWKILGVVLEQTGRRSESLVASQKSVQLSPHDHEAHSNLGNVLQELGRLDEAEASLRQAIALKPDSAEAHSKLGNTLKKLGKLEEAEASYTQTIALKIDHAGALNNLGIMMQERGRFEVAAATYTQLIAFKPDFAEAHSNLGVTLKELGRLEESAASYARAIALKPDLAEAHINLGGMLKQLGRFDEAEASLRQAIALKPDSDKAHNALLLCLYLRDERSLFFDELDYLINQDKTNAVIGSLIGRSILKYGLKRPNVFCENPLKYVLHTDLNAQYDFKEIFVEKAQFILDEKKLPSRTQSLLTKGYQTSGNLFDIENDFTKRVQQAIRLEIEKYRINFKNSAEGFIKKWPMEYSLYGWLISMKSGGELQPHIHEESWLSGSIYINVPPKLKADSGNLVASLGEEKDAIDTRINEKKTINVVTGSMVLFPASLTHYTIPFEAEEERIVLAFDVKEK